VLYKWRAAKKAGVELVRQVVGDLVAQRGDRLPIMPLGAYRATRADGVARTSRAAVFSAGRPWQRGKTAPLAHQEPTCRDAECPVMVKSPPAPPFVMVQSQLLLEFLIIPFDDPAVLGQRHQVLALGRRG